MRRRIHWTIWMLIAVGILGGILVVPSLFYTPRASYERSAAVVLMTIASGQEDFRTNDRDGNNLGDYWRADVAGLYAGPSPDGSGPLRLIDRSVAAADAAPTSPIAVYAIPAPFAGYWYKALLFPGENPSKPAPDRFAVCAFPSSLSAGRVVFILDNRNAVYRRRWNGPSDTPVVFPADPLEEGWSPVR